MANIAVCLANLLQNAVFNRLNVIDAPELPAVHFVKTNCLKNLYHKRMGHISLCTVHLFLRRFVLTGTAELCEEIPKEGFDPPHDCYGHPLKEFWFRYFTPRSKEVEDHGANIP